ncbi:MAG: hypothetical protein ACRC6H_00010 [Culicoidibacterales bacterium]
MLIELFFIAFFIFHAIWGYQKGLIQQLIWLAAISLEIVLWPLVVSFFEYFIVLVPSQNLTLIENQGFQFIFGYFMIYFILKSLLLIISSVKIPLLTPLNRLFGSILAVVKASWLLFLGAKLAVIFWPELIPVLQQKVIISWLTTTWEPILTALIQWLFAWSQSGV